MQFDVFLSAVIYLTTFLTAGACAYFGIKYKKVSLKILAIVLPLILATFRYSTGTDTLTYRQFYNDIGNEPFAASWSRVLLGAMEPVIVLVAKLGAILHLGPSFMFGVFALITLIFLYATAKNFTKSRVWIFYTAMLFFIFPESLNIMRQIAAVSVQAYVLSYIFRNFRDGLKTNVWRCILLTLFAATLHYSSLLLIPVLFLPILTRKVPTRSLILVLSVLAAVCAFAYPYLLAIVSDIGIISEKHLETFAATDGAIINVKFILSLVMAIVFLVNYRRTDNLRDKNLGIILLGGTVYSSVGFYSGYLGRLAILFWVFIIVAIVEMIWQVFEKDRHRISAVLGASAVYFILYYSILGFGAIALLNFAL